MKTIDNYALKRICRKDLTIPVLAMEKLGVEPVARPINIDGSSTSQAYIFVRKDSGIKNIKDMSGKRIAFVDKATVTGYLYFLVLLKKNGIADLDRFFKLIFYSLFQKIHIKQ